MHGTLCIAFANAPSLFPNRKLAHAGLDTPVVVAKGKLGLEVRPDSCATGTGMAPSMAPEAVFPMHMHMPKQHYVAAIPQPRFLKQVLTNPVPAPTLSPKRKREVEEIPPEAHDEECAEGQFNRMLETMSLISGPHSRKAVERYKKIIMPWTGTTLVRSTFCDSGEGGKGRRMNSIDSLPTELLPPLLFCPSLLLTLILW